MARYGRGRHFGHPILAGTIGAVTLPLMCGMWRRHKVVASAGMAACLTMVVTSASSGPILSTAAAIGAMSMWPMRRRMQLVRWAALVGAMWCSILSCRHRHIT